LGCGCRPLSLVLSLSLDWWWRDSGCIVMPVIVRDCEICLGLIRWRGVWNGLPTYSGGSAIGLTYRAGVGSVVSCLRMFESRKSKGGLEVGQQGWTTPRRILRHIELHTILLNIGCWNVRILKLGLADEHRTSFTNAIWYLSLEVEKISY
jgi:hypothetical protein